MEHRRQDRGLVALVIGFAIVAASVLGVLLMFRAHQVAQHRVLHTMAVQESLSRTMSHLQDAETGARGYYITRDPAYLEPYRSGRRGLNADLQALPQQVADHADQKARALALGECVNARIEYLTIGIEDARRGQFGRSHELVRSGRGKRQMDQCRALIDTMKATEQRLLDRRDAALQGLANLLTLWLVLGSVAIFGLAWYATRDARRRAAGAIEAGEALLSANRKLTEEAESRAAAEAQVRQMQKMESIGQLTGGVAHDFNNMLAIVIGSLDMARRRLPHDPDKARDCVDNAMEGAERAAQLTARLLAFSRQQPLAPKPIDANKLVGGMSEMLRRTIGEQVRIETVLAGGLWAAFVDAAQLENAVLNLCVNARDAMPDGGRLTIETACTHLDEGYAANHDEVRRGNM